jgi:PAS domain S-box-containing protein
LYRLLVHNLPGTAVFVFDKNVRYLVADGPFIQTLGYTPEAVVGKTLADIASPARLPLLETQYQAALDGQEVEFEALALGQYPYRGRVVPIRNEDGEIVAGMVVAQDISAQKKAEQQLKASEAQYRLLADHSSDIILQVNADSQWVYVSPSIETVLGYTPNEVLGNTSFDYIHPDDAALVQQARQTTFQGEPSIAAMEFRLRHKQGHYVWDRAHWAASVFGWYTPWKCKTIRDRGPRA